MSTDPTFPRPGFDADTDPRAWLDDDETRMYAAVTCAGIKYTVNLSFKGEAGRQAEAWKMAHSNIDALLRRIAKLRHDLHVARQAAGGAS